MLQVKITDLQRITTLIATHVSKVVQPRKSYLLLSSLTLMTFAALIIWFSFSAPDFPLVIQPSG